MPRSGRLWRITSDLFEITEFAHHFPEEMFIAVIKIIAAFVILLGINPLLTLIVFAALPLMYLIARYYRDRMRRTFQERRHQLGEINAQVEDSLLGIRVVKSFANEPLENSRKFIKQSSSAKATSCWRAFPCPAALWTG